MLGGSIGGSYGSYSGTRSYTAGVSVGPVIDYFITERFSVGVGVAYYLTRRRALQSTAGEIEQSSDGIRFAPRVGIDFPIASWLSFYPQAALWFGSGSITLESAGSRLEYSETSLTFAAFAPLLVHAASHAFIGFGPYVSRDAERKVDIRLGPAGSGDERGQGRQPEHVGRGEPGRRRVAVTDRTAGALHVDRRDRSGGGVAAVAKPCP